MSKFLLIFLLIVSMAPPSLFAEDGSKPLEIPDFSGAQEAIKRRKKDSFVKVDPTTCKTSTGQFIQQGEAGFDSCLTTNAIEMKNNAKTGAETESP